MDKKLYRTAWHSYASALILGIAAVILAIYYLGYWKDFVEFSLSTGMAIIALMLFWLFNTLTYWVKYQDGVWTFRRLGKFPLSVHQEDLISLGVERKALKYKLVIQYQSKNKTRTVRLHLPKSVHREILGDFFIINPEILSESAKNYLHDQA